MQEQALQVSAIRADGDGSTIWGSSSMDGEERDEDKEPEMEEEKATHRSINSILSVRNPPPENHLPTFEEKQVHAHIYH